MNIIIKLDKKKMFAQTWQLHPNIKKMEHPHRSQHNQNNLDKKFHFKNF